MFQIPQYILEKLRCSICRSYLSSKPLMVRAEDQQVCGKCYKLLPTEEKEKCVRQIGLESIAEMLVFPCRYNMQGCSHTFNWCDEKDHEATCQYRSLIRFSSHSSRRSITESIYTRSLRNQDNVIHCECDKIRANLSYDIKESTYTNEIKGLQYSLNIRGNCDKVLVLKDNNSLDELADVEINMDGTILLGSQPQLVFSDIKVKPVEYTNLYESLRSYDSRGRKCSNCGDEYDAGNQVPVSNPGNTSASNICVKCVKMLEKESKILCKNYQKGCREALRSDHAHKHEVNCQYNDYKCILEPCNVISSLPSLKQHIRNHHISEIYITNEINKKFTNKDETFVIFCYGCIFKCVYFYYKTFVEFYVTFVGSSDDAVNYSYEINMNNSNVIPKKSKCSTWNDVMLEKGVSFEKRDLLGENEKKLNLQVNLKIICRK